jgi:cytochrome c-type biogenesis protein CcmF
VENASLLPWITGTAFLHSVMMQEKKGMMKVWNMVLVSATFFLCIFGTFLTRAGIVNSVHAFAQSPIGSYFVAFLALGISITVYFILDRRDYLKSEAQLESVVSRESSFLFNNLILLSSCFAVLWGTLFPVITEAIMKEKISVDAPFFNRVNVPIGLFLLFLTGVGPLIAWRRSSLESLKRAFLWPAAAGVAVMIISGAMGIWEHPYALASLGLCTFVAATIVTEFWKGAAAISGKTGMGMLPAMVELTHRNTRRYGGYIVHMAIVLMFIGFTGQAFNQNQTVEIAKGQTVRIGHYELTDVDEQEGENDNYVWKRLTLSVEKHGSKLGTMEPEKRFYKSSRQPTSEVAIRRRLNEDLYVNFAGPSNDNQRSVVQLYVFPLVSWIWIGWWVLFIGTIICLIPSKVRLQYARTQVVGITKKNVPVTK